MPEAAEDAMPEAAEVRMPEAAEDAMPEAAEVRMPKSEGRGPGSRYQAPEAPKAFTSPAPPPSATQ